MKNKKIILGICLCLYVLTITAIGCGSEPHVIPTRTDNMEATISPGPTATNTPIPSSTQILTNTPTPTITNTPTPTVTNTPTAAVTNTPTPTVTNTPTTTSIPTPTVTNTPIPTQTPKYTYKEMPSVDMWTTTGVNLRTLPSTEGERILVVGVGKKVVVTGQCNETGWYKVSFNGKSGYICNDYLSKTNPAITPTPVVVIEDLVKAALLVNCESKEIVYSYQEKEQITPASITKLMTALLALENGNMEDYLTVSEKAFDFGVPDATTCGLKIGDRITLNNAMYGILLPSGNEAANAIAEHISGDVDTFVSLMNQKASELGMVSTNFGNPHGLPFDGHLTSAWDIYLLMNELLVHEKFFEIADNEICTVPCLDKNGMEKYLEMKNTNLYYQKKKTAPEGITLLGGKTGFTSLAGNCLVLYVENEEGERYIAEIFGAQGKDNLYIAMNRLLEYITDNE